MQPIYSLCCGSCPPPSPQKVLDENSAFVWMAVGSLALWCPVLMQVQHTAELFLKNHKRGRKNISIYKYIFKLFLCENVKLIDYHFCRTLYVCVPWHVPWLSLEKPTVLQVVFDDDIGDGIKHKLHVLGVGGAGKVGVDLFCILFLVQILKLGLDVACCFVIFVGS